MTKLQKRITIVIVATILCCISIVLGVMSIGTVKAENNDELIVTVEQTQDGNEQIHISNIENYMQSTRARLSTPARTKAILDAIGFSGEQIEQLSADAIAVYASAKEIVVSDSQIEITEDAPTIETRAQSESSLPKYNLSIKLVSAYTSDIVVDGASNRVYRLTGYAFYEKNNTYKDIPWSRGVDTFAICWDGNKAMYNNWKMGKVECDLFNVFNSKKKGTSGCTLGDRFMNEFSPGLNSFGMKVDLPDNSLANRYGNFTTIGAVDVFANQSFATQFLYTTQRGITVTEISASSDSVGFAFEQNEKTVTTNLSVIF